ncbi:protein translocase subunit SecDF [Cytophagaceae bacterium DM2B3-1]|uniref:Multifunctional fusion protein n=1 Tax=Xanthocytophaga flava TaxID=3048013 RepID=A0ABT7CLJ2_9BACT|nr:protein translocase subunit SecDF [Xanthocytophaga flavus]MDJ1468251.1 protein translocase subunit SecDF [Xanthocytophaga flavus]MDJ1494618.1 protein translocase subunit SecDF [Xanthocytophaga flavus]
MQNRGLIIFLTIAFSVVSLYYLSFTFVSRQIEQKAVDFATVNGKVNVSRKQAYLDSIWNEKVFLWSTYKEVKEQEVKLGLDLKGGMHVTMEVSAAEVVRILAGNSPDPNFQKALELAQKEQMTKQGNFVDFFYDNFKKLSPNTQLASFFANSSNQSSIKFNSSDRDVVNYVKGELEKTIDLSFEVLRRRIDAYGAVQPNIQRLQGTNRIQIELPGVDDPKRVRKLLQGVAKLEFYQVWDMQDFYPYFIQLNDYLVKQENAKKDLQKSDSVLAKLDAKTNPGKTDTTGNALADQLAKGKGGDSAQAASKANESSTLTKLFTITQGGLLVNVKDTVKVNALLSRPEVRTIFPQNLSFMYDSKPAEADAKGTQLIALNIIKKGRNQGALLGGEVITAARPNIDPVTGRPEVSMQMNASGAKSWARITGQNVGKAIAIVLDNVVYSAPRVQGEIPGGSSSISGNFTIEEAKDLANILVAGKMPVPTRIVEEEVVGPTLGQEAINKGMLSIFGGLLVIILFMVGYYSSSGWVANIAVFLNILMILGVLVQFDAVLTLPGIAGIVLTIGMAVDANVLINERVKDELRAGQPLLAATTEGYRAASVSILDANITTLLAGFVLLWFGVGPVKGFAFTLVAGIFTSLFTSVLVTRLIIDSRLRKGKSFNFFTGFSKNLFKNVNYDFVSKRKIAYIVSAVIIGAGIVSMFVRGFDYGVDFKGGWTYVVQFDKAVTSSEVDNLLESVLPNAQTEVKAYGGTNSLQITTTYLIEDPSENAADKVEATVKQGLDKLNGKYTILSTAKVGPTVATDIKQSSIYSIIIAMGAIFAYIWIRFRKWQYAMGATIALVHDTLIILTVYTLFKGILPFSLDIDQNFIAAVLTIVGFSVNDTVVVFDRVRETFEHNKGESPAKVVNQALNETFSRTVITSVTVVVVVIILLLFGGETIRGLSFALLIGVITGFYSTIYIALPFVVDAYRDNKDTKEKELLVK